MIFIQVGFDFALALFSSWALIFGPFLLYFGAIEVFGFFVGFIYSFSK